MKDADATGLTDLEPKIRISVESTLNELRHKTRLLKNPRRCKQTNVNDDKLLVLPGRHKPSQGLYPSLEDIPPDAKERRASGFVMGGAKKKGQNCKSTAKVKGVKETPDVLPRRKIANSPIL